MTVEGQKELVTEGAVRGMAPGSELVLGPQRIATPAALDLAFQRGIRVRWSEEREPAAAKAGGASDLWSRMKEKDATYVVVVRGGRAVVTRLGERGPEPFGEE